MGGWIKSKGNVCLGGKTRGGPNRMASGTEVSCGVLGDPKQTVPEDGFPPGENDENTTTLRTESNPMTPLFPSPIHPTNFHRAICSPGT